MPDAAKVKYIEDEAHTVPWLGGRLVLPGQVVEVPVEDVYAYTQQADRWEPYDAAAKKAHKQATEARDEQAALDAADLEARFGPAEPSEAAPDEPEPAEPAAPAAGPTPATTPED